MHKHLSRRNFLKTTALAAAGATLPLTSNIWDDKLPTHIGVQLWSVREDMFKNPAATLAAIAKMGYTEVEPFGFDSGKLFKLPYAEFSKILSDNGLHMYSTHSGFTGKHYDAGKKDITDAAKKVFDDAAQAGLRYAIVPWMAEDDRKDIGHMVKAIGAAGAYCQKAGIKLGYHNHDFEFTTKGPDGRLLIEWILQEVPAEQLRMEMDMYWVKFAGFEPQDWFARFPGRWELCHVKDMAKTAKRETVEVGDGSIDFKEIFRHRKTAGLKYYVIELENYVTTPMQGIERARKNFVSIWA